MMLELYYALEEKWFKFLDRAEKHRVPLHKLADPIDRAGIHSLPVVIAVILIILFFVFKFTVSIYTPVVPAYVFTLQIIGEDRASVPDALVIVMQDGRTVAEGRSDGSGLFKAELEHGSYMIRVEKIPCMPYEVNRTITESAEKPLPVEIRCVQ
jgi:hypothetical protein